MKINLSLHSAQFCLKVAILTTLSICSGLAFTQINSPSINWPLKPVRIIVPFVPGGGTDLVARLTAQKLAEQYGQAFVVENKSGAGGTTGTEILAKSKPDGYTFAVVSGSHTINPNLYKNLPYDTKRDFVAVSNLVSGPALFVVHPSLPVNNVRDFISYARSKPGTLSFASSGNGSPPHMAGEMFNALAGLDMIHVPYKGNGAAYNDLLGGQVGVMFPNITTALQYVRSGKLKALGVTSRERSRLAPDIPTLAESGLPTFELTSWFGLVAPAGTPGAIVQRLHQDISKHYQQPEIRDKLLSQGVEPLASTPNEFTTQINNEIDYWARMFQVIKVKPD